MKKSELKSIIRECIEEIYLDEGPASDFRKLNKVKYKSRQRDPLRARELNKSKPDSERLSTKHQISVDRGIASGKMAWRKLHGYENEPESLSNMERASHTGSKKAAQDLNRKLSDDQEQIVNYKGTLPKDKK